MLDDIHYVLNVVNVISGLSATKTSVCNLLDVEQTWDKSKQSCAVMSVDKLQIGGK